MLSAHITMYCFVLNCTSVYLFKVSCCGDTVDDDILILQYVSVNKLKTMIVVVLNHKVVLCTLKRHKKL